MAVDDLVMQGARASTAMFKQDVQYIVRSEARRGHEDQSVHEMHI